MRDVYKETQLRVACYMSKSKNRWIQVAWRRETLKVENAAVTEALTTMEVESVRLKFNDNAIHMDGEQIKQKWKPTWEKVKTTLQKGTTQMRIETSKDQQSRSFRRTRGGMSPLVD